MTDLINKLEEAGEGSRVLDKAVWGALCGTQRQPKPGLFTTSLDAALALAERVLGEKNAMHLLSDLLSAEAVSTDFDLMSIRDLPRLLCAAILRASEEKQS